MPPKEEEAEVHKGCRRVPRSAYHGLTRGACRTALLLILASWLGDCDASYTICSREPEVCNGTYSGTSLCAHTRCVPPLSTAALKHPRLQAVAG